MQRWISKRNDDRFGGANTRVSPSAGWPSDPICGCLCVSRTRTDRGRVRSKARRGRARHAMAGVAAQRKHLCHPSCLARWSPLSTEPHPIRASFCVSHVAVVFRKPCRGIATHSNRLVLLGMTLRSLSKHRPLFPVTMSITPLPMRRGMAAQTRRATFQGWRVVSATFVLAVFGWGLGFYGPPIFLKVLHEQRGWPIGLIATAVTVHFLVGAYSGANMHALHQRFGGQNVTRACSVMMALGLVAWATSWAPWHMFAASLLTGAGWGGMSAAALNAIVSLWFVRNRPSALGMAYNGGSVGGVIFSPLWVAAIAGLGFAHAALAIAATMLLALWILAGKYFAQTPEQMGLSPDGEARGGPLGAVTSGH